MELLYVWIENYKNIKNQGFNFSPKYSFSTKELRIEKYSRHINKVELSTQKKIPQYLMIFLILQKSLTLLLLLGKMVREKQIFLNL